MEIGGAHFLIRSHSEYTISAGNTLRIGPAAVSLQTTCVSLSRAIYRPPQYHPHYLDQLKPKSPVYKISYDDLTIILR